MSGFPITLDEYLRVKDLDPKKRHMIEALLKSLNYHRYTKKTMEQWSSELQKLLDCPA